ncbi:hypothetical protein OUZ56_005737 [Daphnia magna]|uniref:Uncharacterized protein n=1 Tax=Daphnia magna TaxID=35525 RepID=A0ABQ9YUA3_9CRUS|nr:hypothetical protein OUZ56_005737 [Daphnia magna]
MSIDDVFSCGGATKLGKPTLLYEQCTSKAVMLLFLVVAAHHQTDTKKQFHVALLLNKSIGWLPCKRLQGRAIPNTAIAQDFRAALLLTLRLFSDSCEKAGKEYLCFLLQLVDIFTQQGMIPILTHRLELQSVITVDNNVCKCFFKT